MTRASWPAPGAGHPSARAAARLKELFTRSAAATGHGEDELTRFCRVARQELLRAASSLQYDSAVVPGRQLDVPLRPEPFSQLQQRRCHHDGEVEEMHDDAPRRPLIPVTEPEPNGHISAEAQRAALEQRSGMGLLYDLEMFAMKPDPRWMASQVDWIYNKVDTIEQGQDIHERWEEWYSAMYQQQFADTFTGTEMVLSMEKLMQRFGPEMNKAKTESGYNTGADWKTYVNAMKQEVQEMPKVDGTESAEIGGTVQGAQSRGHYSGGTDSDMREADKGEEEEDHYEEEEEEEDHYEEEKHEEDQWADEAHDS